MQPQLNFNLTPSKPKNKVPYAPNSEASKKAAEDIEPITYDLEQKTYELLKQGVFTNSEMAEINQVKLGTQRPRASMLIKKGITIYNLGRTKRSGISEDAMTCNELKAYEYLKGLDKRNENQEKLFTVIDRMVKSGVL